MYIQFLWTAVTGLGWRLDDAGISRFAFFLYIHLEHGGEDELHGGCRRLGNAKNVEMSHKARGDRATSPTRGGCPGDEHSVGDFFPE